MAVLAAVALAACSEGVGGADAAGGAPSTVDAYVEALAADLASDGVADVFVFEGREASCLAEGLVAAIGVDALNDVGVAPAELSAEVTLAELGVDVDDAQLEAIAGTIEACVDVSEEFVAASQVVLGPFAEDADCLAAGVDVDAAARGVAGILAGGEDETSPARLFAVLAEHIDSACFENLLIEGLISTGLAAEEDRACLVEAVDGEEVKSGVVGSVSLDGSGLGAIERALQAASAACPDAFGG